MPSTLPTSRPAGALKPRQTVTWNLQTAILSLAISQDGSRLFAGCHDGGVYEVDTKSGKANPIGKHESYVSGIVLIPDSGQIISAGYDGVLQWHDPARQKSIRRIQAHDFWSWQMAISADGNLVASVTGQYLAGGPKYEPAAEREPSVKIYDTKSGKLVIQFPHLPPAMSVAFSPDGLHLAAGNLMGDVRVWEIGTGMGSGLPAATGILPRGLAPR